MLPLITLVSYLTSFLRERYLIQEAIGSLVLDRSIAAYGAAALVGNTYAIVLGLLWIDGRPIPSWARSFWLPGVGGLALMPWSPPTGACVALASLVSASEYHRQRSAFRDRQAATLFFACVAPGLTIVYWKTFGVDSGLDILGGYCFGYLAQAGGAWLQAANVSRKSASPPGKQPQIVWPIVFAASVQLNGLLDRIVLPLAGPGWAAAAAFSLNLATAAVLVVVAPLASEAVAGRVSTKVSARTIVLVGSICFVALIAIPSGIPLVVGGGMTTGPSLDKVKAFALIYVAAIPAAGYFIFRARALQSSALMWKPIAAISCVSLLVHGGFAVAGVLLHRPHIVAVGWTAGAYVGAGLISRDRWLLPKSPAGRSLSRDL